MGVPGGCCGVTQELGPVDRKQAATQEGFLDEVAWAGEDLAKWFL